LATLQKKKDVKLLLARLSSLVTYPQESLTVSHLIHGRLLATDFFITACPFFFIRSLLQVEMVLRWCALTL